VVATYAPEVRTTYLSFRRVQEFLAEHNYADAQAGLGKHANDLKDVVDQLSAQSLDQEAGEARSHNGGVSSCYLSGTLEGA
jgi:hypothetical protein